MPKHLIALPAGASLPVDVSGLPEGSPFVVEETDGSVVLYVLRGGVWTSAGGGSGGGVSYGRFLPIDETTMANTTVLNPDTMTGSGAGPFSPATDPAGLGISVSTFLTNAGKTAPITGASFPGDTSGGAASGDHTRDAPATTDVLNAGRLADGNFGQSNLLHLTFSTRTTTAVRMDFFYRVVQHNALVAFQAFAFDETGKSVAGQFSDGDPLSQEYGDDPNDGSILWAESDITSGSSWIPASLTIPTGTASAFFTYSNLPGFAPAGTDADMFFEIGYMRFTPVLDGKANGELFVELATQAQWLWDTKIDQFSSVAGQGWTRVREGKVITQADDYDVDAGTEQTKAFYNLTFFDCPVDMNEYRFGLAANDRAPIILTGSLASGSTAGQALKVAGSTPTGWVVPPGFDSSLGRLCVVTFIADATLSGTVVLSISRTDTAGTVTNPWPGLTASANLNQRSTDSRASGYYVNTAGAQGAAIKPLTAGDILKFTLTPSVGPGATTNVQVALYFGGLSE